MIMIIIKNLFRYLSAFEHKLYISNTYTIKNFVERTKNINGISAELRNIKWFIYCR